MRYVLFALLASCGGSKTPAPAPTKPTTIEVTPSAELSAALTPIAWLLGDWAGDGGTLHWVAAGGAVYGVALHGEAYDVFIIDDGDGGGPPDGVLRLWTMANGKTSVDSTKQVVGDLRVTFAKGESIERSGETLRVNDKSYQRGTPEQAPELEAADRAFAADTAKRGVDGWLAAFDKQGGLMRRGSRIEYAGIADAMTPTLTKGKLAWDPIASGKRGSIGFTVGKATYTAPTPEDNWESTYVTIWRKQGDGAWKVLFDTGRRIQRAAR